MVLIRFSKTIQNEEDSFQVPRHCKMEELAKKGKQIVEFTQEGLPQQPLRIKPCTLMHKAVAMRPKAARNNNLLVFQDESL